MASSTRFGEGGEEASRDPGVDERITPDGRVDRLGQLAPRDAVVTAAA
jgi:hypothetical protein